jgi:DNA-binding CsgD family transcriptional regulator
VGRLLKVGRRLGEAAVDPAIWPDIMEEICAAVRATGVLLLQTDERTPDGPRTESVREFADYHLRYGWHTRSVRAVRALRLLLSGTRALADEDIFGCDELEPPPYINEFTVPMSFKWAAGGDFYAGLALWGLCLHRRNGENPFNAEEVELLAALADKLAETVTLSKAVGKAVLSGVTNGLQLIKQPALALDGSGCIVDMNAAVETILDDEVTVKHRRLCLCDKQAKSLLDAFLEQLRTLPDTSAFSVSPIVVQRRAKQPLVICILPVDGVARGTFFGARVLLVLTDLTRRFGPQPDVLARAFGLTPAEARLAAIIATGLSTEKAAEHLGIGRETARSQLKAVFAKTNTHRQSELVALLSRISNSSLSYAYPFSLAPSISPELSDRA